jgi:hypothetical protein
MDLILTRKQYIKLLTEEKKTEVAKTMEDSSDFVRNVVNRVKKQYKIDYKFALSWGPAIGGFVGPIGQFLNGQFPEITENELFLIIFSLILTFFSDNKEKLNEALRLIKEKKLVTYFNIALSKSYDLKTSFTNFLESLNVAVSSLGNIMAYCFLIPLIGMLFKVRDMDFNYQDLEFFIKSIVAHRVALLTNASISEIVKKIILRFKS